MLKRKPYERIWKELAQEKSMILLSGPRQCGKTTLARMLAQDVANSLYFNWDLATDKRKLIQNPYFFAELPLKDNSRPLVILDEIHKYRSWKSYLKGVSDGFGKNYQFLITGSGRLDLYQRGGDSLAGRYLPFRLWPLTLSELHGTGREAEAFFRDPLSITSDDQAAVENTWRRLAKCSGFPEPFLANKPTTYRRWSRIYHRQIVREDIRDLSGIRNTDDLEILSALLPSKVGSPLSIPNLASDLRVAYNTVRNWLTIMERFYLTFSVTPWTREIARAIHKERKIYLFDYACIDNEAARYENMVALELLRAVSGWNDLGLGDFGLHYIRTKEGREVDFLISNSRRPMLLVEAKLGELTPSENLERFQKALGVPAVQIVDKADGYFRYPGPAGKLLVSPAAWWLRGLP